MMLASARGTGTSTERVRETGRGTQMDGWVKDGDAFFKFLLRWLLSVSLLLDRGVCLRWRLCLS